MAVILRKTPPSTNIGALEARFSLVWTGNIELVLMPILSSSVAGRTVSWAPVSAVARPVADLVGLF